MHCMLVNDDGIAAPGIAALARGVAEFGRITVVAPEQPHSGCGHRVNNYVSLGVTELRPAWLAIDGTPPECTRLGLLHLAPDVDWVLSGVNDGGNLGIDVYMSGTAAAAREAALFGRKAIAFSQYKTTRDEFDWERAVPLVTRVFALLQDRPLAPGCFWNVNFPDVPGRRPEECELVFCPLETQHHAVSYEIRGDRYHYVASYHGRGRTPGSDVDACFGGRVAITQIPLA